MRKGSKCAAAAAAGAHEHEGAARGEEERGGGEEDGRVRVVVDALRPCMREERTAHHSHGVSTFTAHSSQRFDSRRAPADAPVCQQRPGAGAKSCDHKAARQSRTNHEVRRVRRPGSVRDLVAPRPGPCPRLPFFNPERRVVPAAPHLARRGLAPPVHCERRRRVAGAQGSVRVAGRPVHRPLVACAGRANERVRAKSVSMTRWQQQWERFLEQETAAHLLAGAACHR